MGVGYSNCKVTGYGGPLEYRTFWTIIRLFSVQFSDHHSTTGPFDNRTQIYHSNTRLVWYSDGYCKLKNPKECCYKDSTVGPDYLARLVFRLPIYVSLFNVLGFEWHLDLEVCYFDFILYQLMYGGQKLKLKFCI